MLFNYTGKDILYRIVIHFKNGKWMMRNVSWLTDEEKSFARKCDANEW